MALQWTTGTVVRKQIWSDGLFTLSVRCPDVQPFEPGQFLQVGVQLPEKHLHRPYSVASPHGDILDFFIVKVEGGELSPRLWGLHEGDPVDVSIKATGGFTLSHVPPSECIWLMATGTGLAPYIAMLRESLVWNRYNRIILVHGVRYLSDLAYLHELHEYQAKYSDRFQFIPVISRQDTAESIHSRITTAIENGTLESRAQFPLTPDRSVVMMCGNPQMLDDVEEQLKGRGMTKHKATTPGHYVVERYW